MVSVAASLGYPQGGAPGPRERARRGAIRSRDRQERPRGRDPRRAASRPGGGLRHRREAIVGGPSPARGARRARSRAGRSAGAAGSTSAMARSVSATPSSVPTACTRERSNTTVPTNWSVRPSAVAPHLARARHVRRRPGERAAPLIDARHPLLEICPAGSAARARAMPKSSTFTHPSSRTMTFSRLRRGGRCRPGELPPRGARTSSTGQLSRRCSAGTPARPMRTRARVRPKTIARKGVPSCSPTSKIETALGWSSAAAARPRAGCRRRSAPVQGVAPRGGSGDRASAPAVPGPTLVRAREIGGRRGDALVEDLEGDAPLGPHVEGAVYLPHPGGPRCGDPTLPRLEWSSRTSSPRRRVRQALGFSRTPCHARASTADRAVSAGSVGTLSACPAPATAGRTAGVPRWLRRPAVGRWSE